jgi:putative flippase GtrA
LSGRLPRTAIQLSRYAVVGLLSNGIAFGLYLVITALGVGPKAGMTLVYALGVAQTFVFNRRWSFGHRGTQGPAFVRYCLAYVFGYAFNVVVLMILVDRLALPHRLVQAVTIPTLAVLLFLAQKYWVFADTRPAAVPAAD